MALAGAGDNPVGTLSFASAAYDALQNLGTKIVTVDRVGGAGGAASVLCKTYNNSAAAGRDYAAISRVLTWASGDTSPKNCDVTINNATPFLGTRRLYIELSDAHGAGLGSQTKATLTIYGSYQRGMLSFTSANFTAAQNLGTKTIYVNRTGGSRGAANVLCSTHNNSALAGHQFTTVSRVLTWTSGDASLKSCDVAISNAPPFVGNKSFYVELSDAHGAGLGSLAKTTVTINGSEVTRVPPPNGAVLLTWARPQFDTLGESLTNLAGYTIHYGNSPAAMNSTISIGSATTLEYEIGNLTAGTWYFAITAYTSAGVDSAPSSIVSSRI